MKHLDPSLGWTNYDNKANNKVPNSPYCLWLVWSKIMSCSMVCIAEWLLQVTIRKLQAIFSFISYASLWIMMNAFLKIYDRFMWKIKWFCCLQDKDQIKCLAFFVISVASEIEKENIAMYVGLIVAIAVFITVTIIIIFLLRRKGRQQSKWTFYLFQELNYL